MPKLILFFYSIFSKKTKKHLVLAKSLRKKPEINVPVLTVCLEDSKTTGKLSINGV